MLLRVTKIAGLRLVDVLMSSISDTWAEAFGSGQCQ